MGESGVGRARLTEQRLAGWSALHGGIDPSRVPLLRMWLRFVWVTARPLRAVAPTLVTVAGAGSAVTAVLVAGRSPWIAFGLVILSVLCDGWDGAIALLRDRATAAGAVADRAADRVSDVAFALVMWRCGAPLWLALVAALLALVHEGWREVRGRGRYGGQLRVRLTVAERPTRAVCALLASASAGVASTAWPATVCAATWTVLGVVGLVQLITTAAADPSTAVDGGGAARVSAPADT